MPSTFSVSYAYAISASVASTSGNGIAANSPNRVGCCCTSFAPYSLQARASCFVIGASPNHRPGFVIETIDAATPPRSMSSMDFSGVQVVLAGWRSGFPLTAVTHAGGAK